VWESVLVMRAAMTVCWGHLEEKRPTGLKIKANHSSVHIIIVFSVCGVVSSSFDVTRVSCFALLLAAVCVLVAAFAIRTTQTKTTQGRKARHT
jgi:hypothetical protein